MLDDYLPCRVNQGPWVTAYTLYELREITRRAQADGRTFVLPICSLATPYRQCASLGDLVLPPLYHEALDDSLKDSIVSRILQCFPIFGGDNSGSLKIVELEPRSLPSSQGAEILAFSVDTAVEEHGPHLPLATDTIQSYSVLNELAKEFDELEVCRPLDYGQLTWGLPFGFSIDLTGELLTQYVSRYVNALVRWKQPRAVYVVDVHGSIVHRRAIVRGLQESGFSEWTFRWLHQPLAEFASERGDQHAGGVETALVQRVSPELLDASWWPARIDDIAEGQMSFQQAVDLAKDLEAFTAQVVDRSLNGVIGDLRNYHQVDADEMFQRMISVARQDVGQLCEGKANQSAGDDLW